MRSFHAWWFQKLGFLEIHENWWPWIRCCRLKIIFKFRFILSVVKMMIVYDCNFSQVEQKTKNSEL